MKRTLIILHLWGVALLILAACNQLPMVASVQPVPTIAPEPDEIATAEHDIATPVPPVPLITIPQPSTTHTTTLNTGFLFPPGATVAGVDIGGLDIGAAAERLQTSLQELTSRPLELRAGDSSLILYPDEVGMSIPIDGLLALARSQAERGNPVNIPIELQLNTIAMSEQIAMFAEQTTTPSSITVTSTSPISRSFVLIPPRRINVHESLVRIRAHLRSPNAAEPLTLPRTAVRTDQTPTRATPEQLLEQFQELAAQWDGLVSVYLYDLESGTVISLNEQTVFSGASVMKVPIMLQVYTSLDRFTAQQWRWLSQMIVESDNQSANALLAASVRGTTLEDSLAGLREMNQKLAQLGLPHTYQRMPYESSRDLPQMYEQMAAQATKHDGEPPYTLADPVIRTTSAEISQVFLLIHQCSLGTGALLELFPEHLSALRCQEMLNWLSSNNDMKRMRAGLPPDIRVEHKSGWVEDMQADVGIVHTPGGDFLLAVYLYEDIRQSDNPRHYLRDEAAGPMIAAFARLAYTAYNPVELDISE